MRVLLLPWLIIIVNETDDGLIHSFHSFIPYGIFYEDIILVVVVEQLRTPAGRCAGWLERAGSTST
jgi:hypothetical protein